MEVNGGVRMTQSPDYEFGITEKELLDLDDCICSEKGFLILQKVRSRKHIPPSGRDKVLNSIIDLVDGRIAGLDNLLATPAEQRTESAQDKYLKEARFELGLVQDEYKELRTPQEAKK